MNLPHPVLAAALLAADPTPTAPAVGPLLQPTPQTGLVLIALGGLLVLLAAWRRRQRRQQRDK